MLWPAPQLASCFAVNSGRAETVRAAVGSKTRIRLETRALHLTAPHCCLLTDFRSLSPLAESYRYVIYALLCIKFMSARISPRIYCLLDASFDRSVVRSASRGGRGGKGRGGDKNLPKMQRGPTLVRL